MIKKYTGFLLENFRYNATLILEAQLSATGGFLDKLDTISKEKGMAGEIAKNIKDFIEKEGWVSDDNIKQNYFDTTEKEDMISFLMQSKLPKDWDEEVDPSLPYNTKGRTEVKVSKIIKYIVTLMDAEGEWNSVPPKDKDIEAFVNAFKATKASTDFKFKEIKGDEIAKYYNQKKYFNSSGTLGGSCMADESKGTFKIYSQNETKVKLLVFIDEKQDKISGRAILWKLSKSPCDANWFMDRVYTNRDSDFIKFKNYAEEKGYLYKSIMNSHTSENVKFRYKGSDVQGIVKVKLDGSAKSYPFIDTMCFLNKDKTELSNVPSVGSFFLHSVSGDCDHCSDCDGKMFICDDYQCGYNNGEIDCDECNSSGMVDGKKCTSCKGTGYIKCDHPNTEICNDCCDGLMTLGVRTVEDLKKISK
jgi:hypothetical protein